MPCNMLCAETCTHCFWAWGMEVASRFDELACSIITSQASLSIETVTPASIVSGPVFTAD